MPRFFFHVRHGRFSPDEVGVELPDLKAAWEQATTACGEMIRDLDGLLQAGPEWGMEVADEAGRTRFRIRFLTETCD